jgi:hypothetical protein
MGEAALAECDTCQWSAVTDDSRNRGVAPHIVTAIATSTR